MKNNRKRTILFLITVILMSIYLLWRTFFTLPFQAGTAQLIAGVMLLLAELATVLGSFELYYQKTKNEKSKLDFPEVSEECYPHVDVFVATHNEPVNLLHKTVNACTYMEYPDAKKVHIYICDDGNRKEVAKLAEELGVNYLGLAENKDAKSGNYNHALKMTSSPLIVTFDADMIPQRSFLMKTVPYFFLPDFIKENGVWRSRRKEERDENYKMGLVQTPQSFYNPDLFQFNFFAEKKIPNEQDFFSREINILRNSANAIAYTGSNTVISRKAMEEIGGFPLKTITEDFETSIRLQQAGYITYATEEVLAAGLTTTTVSSMMKQRSRWARGVIQSIQNTNAVFSRKLPLTARIVYLNAYLYWWSFLSRLIFILAPILFALFDFQLADCDFGQLLIFWLPAYLCYSVSAKLLSGNIRNQRWNQIIDTILAPYLILPVFLESVGIHQLKFKVTNKEKTQEQERAFFYIIPYLVLFGLSVAALIRFVHGKYGMALVYSSVIIYWIFHNLFAIVNAIFFMCGRRSPRQYQRIAAEENVTIQWENQTVVARTVNLSEGGMKFKLDYYTNIPIETEIRFTISTKYYEANLVGKILYIMQKKGCWYCRASVEPVDETNKREYEQCIYDRNHSLPQEMDIWSTAYDDFVRNVSHRLSPERPEQRKRPRFPVNREIQ